MIAGSVNIHISHLIDTPGASTILAGWFADQWGPNYGFEGPGNVNADLTACSERDHLPICLVARDDTRTLLGAAALRSYVDETEKAWLVGLLIGAEHRGKGVAPVLIDEILSNALRLGFDEIFTTTIAGAGLLEAAGWTLVGEKQTLRGQASVYRRNTGGA